MDKNELDDSLVNINANNTDLIGLVSIQNDILRDIYYNSANKDELDLSVKRAKPQLLSLHDAIMDNLNANNRIYHKVSVSENRLIKEKSTRE